LRLETDLAAWALDEACLMVGRRVENNLAQEKPAFDGFPLTGTGAMPRSGMPQSYKNTGHKPVKKKNLDFLKDRK